MSPFLPLFESLTSVLVGSIALTLALKWTVVLALAWMIHTSWASTCAGEPLLRAVDSGRSAIVAISLLTPPIVEYRFTDRGSTAIDVARSQPGVRTEKGPKKPEVPAGSGSTEAASPPPWLVLDAAATNQS